MMWRGWKLPPFAGRDLSRLEGVILFGPSPALAKDIFDHPHQEAVKTGELNQPGPSIAPSPLDRRTAETVATVPSDG